MKKLITLGIAFVAILAISATAGDYHSGASLNCAECHVMHFSESHGLTDDGAGSNVALGAGGPFHYLLRNHVNELCLTCHDGNAWAPDVLGATTGGLTPNGRLGGALNKAGAAVTGYHESDGHSLDFMGAAPGQTGATATAAWTNTDGLDCTDCHTQHGRKAGSGATATSIYRNLSWPGSAAAGYMSYAIGTNDLTKDVYERFPASYDVADVDFNEPVATASDYALFCSKCHGDFHGNAVSTNMRNQAASNVAAEWLRHPVANADIGLAGGGGSRMSSFGAREYRVKTMSASGSWGTQGTALGITTGVGDFTPSCMTCHKAHGTKNAYGLIFPDYSYGMVDSLMTPITEDGGGSDYMGLCRQCHGQ
jgi:hypothetical protein